MAKYVLPAAQQASTDLAVRWIAGLLLIVCLGFCTSLLLDQLNAPASNTITTSSHQ